MFTFLLSACYQSLAPMGGDTGADTGPDVTEDPNDIDTDPPDGTRFCADLDGDAYGDTYECVVRNEAPAGYVADDHDCDDANPLVHPGGIELDEDVDEDCDGMYAESFAECDAGQWCVDDDGDGFGDPARCVEGEEPDDDFHYTDNDNDCDDTNAWIFPGASEDSSDLADEDCDGMIDEEYTFAVVCMRRLDRNLAQAELFAKSALDSSLWPTCAEPLVVWPDCDISDSRTEIYGSDHGRDDVNEMLTYVGEDGWVCGAIRADFGGEVVVGGLGLAGDRVRLVIDEDLDPISLVRVRIDGEESVCTRQAQTFSCFRPYRTDRATRCDD